MSLLSLQQTPQFLSFANLSSMDIPWIFPSHLPARDPCPQRSKWHNHLILGLTLHCWDIHCRKEHWTQQVSWRKEPNVNWQPGSSTVCHWIPWAWKHMPNTTQKTLTCSLANKTKMLRCLQVPNGRLILISLAIQNSMDYRVGAWTEYTNMNFN